MRRWLLATGVACMACSGAFSGEAAEPTPVQGEAPIEAKAPAAPDSTAKPAPEPLPDLKAGLQRGQCDNGPGNEGADSHYLGAFTIDGSMVSGTETWLLFANPKWVNRGGLDCDITWRVSGRTGTTGACADCDLGVSIHAQPDVEGSGCPEALIKAEARPFDVEYAIKRTDDGVAWVYWAKSGRLLGQGYHAGNRINYVSQHQCKWF